MLVIGLPDYGRSAPEGGSPIARTPRTAEASEVTAAEPSGARGEPTPTRRELSALAAVLAATILTAAAAIAGLARTAAPLQPSHRR